MNASVTAINGGRPSLADIPGRLRFMADAMEDGSWSDDKPQVFVFVEYGESGAITVGAIGERPLFSKAEVVGILALAQRRFDHEVGDLYRGDNDIGDAAPVHWLHERGNTMKKVDDPNEGGVAPSNPSTTPVAPPVADNSSKTKKYGLIAVGVVVALAVIFLIAHH